MRRQSVAQIAAAAALAVFGMCGPTLASPIDGAGVPHFLSVDLPGGGVARITYFGELAPHIVVDPQAAADNVAQAYVMVDPFTALDRMAAMMDAETSAMMRQAAALAAAPMPSPGELIESNFGNAPAGAVSTTYIASFGDHGVCTHRVEMVSQGPGMRPRVVSQSSGDCGAASPMARPPQRARMFVPAESAPAARLVKARAESHNGAAPYSGMIHPAVIYTGAD